MFDYGLFNTSQCVILVDIFGPSQWVIIVDFWFRPP